MSSSIPIAYPNRTSSTRLWPGALFPARSLTPVQGDALAIPDSGALVHLQLRRFAGCPVCNLHLRSFERRHDDVSRAGVREVVVFHARPEQLRPHVAHLPFAVVADPDKRLYRELGVESAARSLLDPRVWPRIVVAVAVALFGVVRGHARAPALRPHGGRLGLPADFLIGPDGRVLACKYGEHAGDQWSVDDLLALVARARGQPSVRQGRQA